MFWLSFREILWDLKATLAKAHFPLSFTKIANAKSYHLHISATSIQYDSIPQPKPSVVYCQFLPEMSLLQSVIVTNNLIYWWHFSKNLQHCDLSELLFQTLDKILPVPVVKKLILNPANRNRESHVSIGCLTNMDMICNHHTYIHTPSMTGGLRQCHKNLVCLFIMSNDELVILYQHFFFHGSLPLTVLYRSFFLSATRGGLLRIQAMFTSLW